MKTKSQKNQSLIIIVIAIMYFAAVLSSVDYQLSNLWFLTPGIWGMEGVAFWKAFLFELPFVMLRIFPVILIAVVIIANAIKKSMLIPIRNGEKNENTY